MNAEPYSPLCEEYRKKVFNSEHQDLVETPYWNVVWMKLKANKLVMAAFCVFIITLLMAIIGPQFSHYSISEITLELKNQPPGAKYWFGTDELGRDFFARCWWGARISLFVGFIATLLDVFIGVLYGSYAGYMGGKIDEAMMRVADVLYSIPHFLLVLLIMVMIGPGIMTIVVALSITGWINMARIVRSHILQIKQQDFIKASYAFGGSRKWIIYKHLIPNVIGPIIVTLTFTLPTAIFGEAFLSFLGLGVQSPFASLGTLASDGLAAIRFYPWRLVIPSVIICLITLSLNIVGDGLREALDPKNRLKV